MAHYLLGKSYKFGVMNIQKQMLDMLGWSLKGEMPAIRKSIIVVAPHTSYWDAVIGKLVLGAYGVPHRLLSKKELFRFPMNIVMRSIGAIPIRNVIGQNSIVMASCMLKSSDNLHLVICPEGGFAPTDHWNPGFLMMARMACVPVIVAFIDYKQKTAGIKTVIYDTEDENAVIRLLAEAYSDITARHPENFLLPKTREQRKAKSPGV